MTLTYQDATQFLEQRPVMPQKAPTLEPMSRALEKLKLPYPDDLSRIIVVAGTNGKGSTCKTLQHLLMSEDFTVGLYTSPHLACIRERININNEDITEDEFATAFSELWPIIQEFKLTHFEILTAMAAWHFFSPIRRRRVDYAIFEVGMGGTWDATNAIPHGVSVITRLGFDHVPVLGTTLSEIAKNKFGIIKKNQIVISQHFEPEVKGVAEEVQRRTQTQWIFPPAFHYEVQRNGVHPQFILNSKWGRTEISLPGLRGAENMNLALSVFEALGYAPQKRLSVLNSVLWAGRLQPLTVPPDISIMPQCPVLLSGDHNVQGVKSLIEALQYYEYKTLWLLISIGLPKNLDEMMELFLSIPCVRVTLTSAHFMARSQNEYGRWVSFVEGYNAEPAAALKVLLEKASPGDLVLVSGSLYLVGDILASF